MSPKEGNMFLSSKYPSLQYERETRPTALSVDCTIPMQRTAYGLAVLFLTVLWWLSTPGPYGWWFAIYLALNSALVYMVVELLNAHGMQILRFCGLLLTAPHALGNRATRYLCQLLGGWGLVLAISMILIGTIVLTAVIVQSDGLNWLHGLGIWFLSFFVLGSFAVMYKVDSRH